MKAIEIQSPNEVPETRKLKVFLAGSIEMGKATNWQKELIELLKDERIVFLNPRRDDWDSNWVQHIDNPQFKEQVEWEINGMKISDVVVMVFDPNTMSPISLLELGLNAHCGCLVVMCPDGFWRKGNVDIVCAMHNIKQVENLESMGEYIINELDNI
jgi:hypothetical protein